MNINRIGSNQHAEALKSLQGMRNLDDSHVKSEGTQKSSTPMTHRSARNLFERIGRHIEGAKIKSKLNPVNQVADKFIKGIATGKMSSAKTLQLLSKMRDLAIKSGSDNPKQAVYTALKEQLGTMSAARRTAFAEMLTPELVKDVGDQIDGHQRKTQDLNGALGEINPGLKLPTLPDSRGAGQLKSIITDMHNQVMPDHYASQHGKAMSQSEIRELEMMLLKEVSRMEKAPAGALASTHAAGRDKFRTSVTAEIRVQGFIKHENGGLKEMTLEEIVGVIKSAYENKPVLPLETLRSLINSPSVSKAVGTLTGHNTLSTPEHEMVGDDTPQKLKEGALELKQLIDRSLTTEQKQELKSRMDFLSAYSLLAKDRFGHISSKQQTEEMRGNQWIKSATVSYGLFAGIPQNLITKGGDVREVGIQARDLFTSLAMHTELIFAELGAGDTKFWDGIANLMKSQASEEQIASFCEANDRPVPSKTEIEYRLKTDDSEVAPEVTRESEKDREPEEIQVMRRNVLDHLDELQKMEEDRLNEMQIKEEGDEENPEFDILNSKGMGFVPVNVNDKFDSPLTELSTESGKIDPKVEFEIGGKLPGNFVVTPSKVSVKDGIINLSLDDMLLQIEPSKLLQITPSGNAPMKVVQFNELRESLSPGGRHRAGSDPIPTDEFNKLIDDLESDGLKSEMQMEVDTSDMPELDGATESETRANIMRYLLGTDDSGELIVDDLTAGETYVDTLSRDSQVKGTIFTELDQLIEELHQYQK